MSDTSNGDTFTMSGDFRGAIINIKSTLTNVTQTVGALPDVDQSTKQELQKLVEQLSQALQEVPPEREEDAELVAEYTQELVDRAAEENPKKAKIQITGEGLKQAAQNIADVMPTVLVIATQIVTTVAKLAQ
jgi:hypothetical protein